MGSDDGRGRHPGQVREAGPALPGLAKEVVVIKDAEDPLLYLERKAYLTALQDALAGVESARVVLAKALHRLEGRAA